MQVFILTEGGKNIGFGHITRCTAIYQAFEEVGILPDFIVNGDEAVQDLLPSKNCKVFNWLINRETLFATIENADIVLIDSYLADYDLYEKISNLVKMAVYFDDDMRINYPKGFVVNGAIFAEQMPYPKRKGVTYLLGAQYAPLRKEFWDVPEKQISDNIETVMITFGGTDIHNLTPKVLKLLVNTHPELCKKVIIGRSFQNITEIEKLRDNNTELIYYPNANQMKKVMLKSDIAISAGGQTLYELARVGIPTIAVTVAVNQIYEAEAMQKVGFVEYIGWWEQDETFKRLGVHLNKLMDYTFRQEKLKSGRQLINGCGASRIVDFLIETALR